MGKKILVLLSAILISQATCQVVLADIINFNIAGTYSQGLTAGGVTLFSAGDTFNIQGSFDTATQPHMVTKVNPDFVLSNMSLPPYYLNFAAIINLTHNIPLDQINAYYPSYEDSRNDTDYKNGMYFLTTNFPADGFSFYLADDYTELSVSMIIGYGASGFINYNYHLVERTLTSQRPRR